MKSTTLALQILSFALVLICQKAIAELPVYKDSNFDTMSNYDSGILVADGSDDAPANPNPPDPCKGKRRKKVRGVFPPLNCNGRPFQLGIKAKGYTNRQSPRSKSPNNS
jgi:hypothetical protein